MWPEVNDQVEQALQEAYTSGNWGRYHGPQHDLLVEDLQAYFQVPHAFPCCSGTFAVELALRSLKVGTGDEVILAGYDFSGNFRSIEATGAKPVLIDIEPSKWCLNPDLIQAAVSDSTRAIVVSHLHGGSANMPEVMKLAREKGLLVVEDACQNPGATVYGKLAGTWGDVGVLSFGGSKLMTAGRGGAILTSDIQINQRAKIYCEQGNNAFAMSELQASVLRPQLKQLDDKNVSRLANVKRLLEKTSDLENWRPLDLNLAETMPAFFKVPWLVGVSEKGIPIYSTEQIDHFIKAIKAEGIAIDRGFRGFNKRSARRCRVASELQHTQRAAEQTLLLHHPILLQDGETIDRLAQGIQKVFDAILR